jgi:peroxin-5
LQVLGVLYNVTRDYDAAVDCFAAAAASKPLDYSVWNKLGATRANSQASQDALPAYHKALALKPRYKRAQTCGFNVAP